MIRGALEEVRPTFQRDSLFCSERVQFSKQGAIFDYFITPNPLLASCFHPKARRQKVAYKEYYSNQRESCPSRSTSEGGVSDPSGFQDVRSWSICSRTSTNQSVTLVIKNPSRVRREGKGAGSPCGIIVSALGTTRQLSIQGRLLVFRIRYSKIWSVGHQIIFQEALIISAVENTHQN